MVLYLNLHIKFIKCCTKLWQSCVRWPLQIELIINQLGTCYKPRNRLSSSLAVCRADDDCSMLWSSNHGFPDWPFSSSSLPGIKTNIPPLQVPFNNIFKSEAWTTLVSCSWTQLGKLNGNWAKYFLYVCNGKIFKELFTPTLTRKAISVWCTLYVSHSRCYVDRLFAIGTRTSKLKRNLKKVTLFPKLNIAMAVQSQTLSVHVNCMYYNA